MRNFSSHFTFSDKFKHYRLMLTVPVCSGRQVRKAPRRRRLWWCPGNMAEEDEVIRRKGIQIYYTGSGLYSPFVNSRKVKMLPWGTGINLQ